MLNPLHNTDAVEPPASARNTRGMTQSQPDPVAWMLDHAPLDDEPETDEERRAVALVRADRARGIEPVPLDEVLREFHSTLDPPDVEDFARWLDSRPEDDEPLTAAEREALAESDADIAAGRTVSFEEIKRQIGGQAR
ncbi:MAG TPA: hypothetical protein VFS59_09245 [Gemmatimonadaceae bacterium]|nr:hypothetical protein [Gemmatimonadaceae bacterium]